MPVPWRCHEQGSDDKKYPDIGPLALTAMARAISYVCFLLIGAAVFRLQHIIIFGRDPDVLASNIRGTVVFVAVLCLIALANSFRARIKELPLIALFLFTAVLGVLQFGPVPHLVLNTYARCYAGLCVYISLWKLASGLVRGRAARAGFVAIMIVLAIVLVLYLFALQIEAGARLA